MKYWLILVLGLVCAAAGAQDLEVEDTDAAPSAGTTSTGSTSGTVISAMGQAFLYPEGAPDRKMDLNETDMVYTNYIIETVDSAHLVIKLTDGKGYLQIFEKSNVQIQYYYSNKMKLGGFRILLNKGKVRAYCPGLKSPRLHFTVITNNCSVGVDFGDFSVEVVGEVTYILTYLNDAVVHYLSPEFNPNTRKAIVPEEKKYAVTNKGMAKRPIDLNEEDAAQKESWAKYDITIEYPQKETRQDVLIKKEIKRIENETIKNPALKYSL